MDHFLFEIKQIISSNSSENINYKKMLDENVVFKMIVLGQQGVGKSSMLMRYIKGEFSQQYNVTVGVEFASKNVIVNDKTQVKLQIWDTAGQETFRAIVRSFYKGIAAVFLCFAIDNEDTLQALRKWHAEVRENASDEVMFFLIGTRLDLQSQRKVTAQQANKVLKEMGGYFYIQTSSKTNINVEELFDKAAKLMHKKYVSSVGFRHLVRPTMASGIDFQRRQSFNLDLLNNKNNRITVEEKKKKGCC